MNHNLPLTYAKNWVKKNEVTNLPPRFFRYLDTDVGNNILRENYLSLKLPLPTTKPLL